MPAEERERLETWCRCSSARLRRDIRIDRRGQAGRAVEGSDPRLGRGGQWRTSMSRRDDVFAAVLPPFHVGGLGVYARCAPRRRARASPMAWDPRAFAESEATIASLVPAQVHDLVAAGLRPPPTLRAILVGGGAFDPALAARARALGWPRSRELRHERMRVDDRDRRAARTLPHLEARIESDDRLAFRGSSLFTGYVENGVLIDPKIDGWFISEDLGDVDGRTLHHHGRPSRLREDRRRVGRSPPPRPHPRLDHCRRRGVFAVPDERLGHVIHLATTRDDPRAIREFIGEFNARVLPFERIRAVHRVDEIPRSPLGKLLRRELEKRIR